MSVARTSPTTSPATWIAGALFAMPFLQLLPIDFDRTGVLVLSAPVLWAGRSHLHIAAGSFLRTTSVLRFLTLIALAVTVLSVAFASQPAPALTTAATWVLLAAVAAISAETVRKEPGAGPRILFGLVAGAAASVAMMWALWVAGGRSEAVPVYAHHRHVGLHAFSAALASIALLLQPAQHPARRVVTLVLAIVTWAGMLWSGGRAPVLAVVLGIAVWVWCAPGSRLRILAIAAILGTAGLLLSATFWTQHPHLGWWHAMGRTASAATAGDTRQLTSTRNEFWRESAQRALRAPWLGHGPDGYRYLTPKLDGQQPHNVVLQLWIDVGALGALPVLGLIGAAVIRGVRRMRAYDSPTAGWLAILVAGLAFGLLDGVFYHLLSLLPVSLALGVCLTRADRTPDASIPRPADSKLPSTVASFLVITAAAALVVHSMVFFQLALAAPPRSPDAWQARLVRSFPSTTFGLWRWLDAWQSNNPKATLDWSRWAQTRSANRPFFHVYAARLLSAQGDSAGARAELLKARETAHWTVRPDIDAMMPPVQTSPH